MKQLRVVLLDDSSICRAQLTSFLQMEGDIKVVGEAADGSQVLELLRQTQADLLVVDLQMPGSGGHETIVRVMAHAPLPILVVTGQPLGPGRTLVFESIRKGALDLAEKPSLLDQNAQKQLRNTVRRLATVPVVRHIAGKLHESPKPLPRPSVLPPPGSDLRVVGIASSAGGPLALATLLGTFALDLPAAVVVVQHLPANFFSVFAEFLSARTQLRVVPVEQKEALRAGVVYAPSGDSHIGLVDAQHVGPIHGPQREGHRPSADVLFESLGQHAKNRASGVVLSGIGRDGTEGLLSLRNQGGLCLAQNQETCAVWGMPRSAIESGAAELSLAPTDLAHMVSKWAKQGRLR